MIDDYPETPAFTIPANRVSVTEETPRADGGFDPCFPDHEWFRLCDQGGGHVPDEHEWTSNPKQVQDDLGSQ